MTTELEIVQDWRVFATEHSLSAVELSGDEAIVTWSDGRKTPLNRFFLRDNCTCSTCYLPLTREQLFEITDAPADLAAASAGIDAEGNLVVGWSDGHKSSYAPGWLRSHAPDAESRAERHAARARPFIWGREYADALQSFDYADIMADDGALWAWLSALRSSGLTLVRNVPVEEEALLAPISRISHLRETNFGRVFDVKSKPRADSAAYTSVNLPPHTDLPTRELQPGVQFLHCLKNEAVGGESVFVDGFAIGEAMRAEHPDEFATITTAPMAFWNRDDRTDYRWTAPAIALNVEGDLDEVRFANFLRGPIDAPAERMGEIYAALRLFQAMTRDPRFFIERRLSSGDMWAFDNRRVMHARREFDPQTGERHLQGAYVDRDEINSRWRVLSRQLGEPC
ncbi:gamma-butyrobetaine dioxygenase [Novosphingobium nitrogenifigens DSM 19370]|uniref:Gamma-butyrobetaine dioxygenase n=1 Tax=Novosphingobium nitrogenifigens DSM 19370 TaxID=983920 RepID=F1ZCH6_9SPHN|nr:TauD/TfdA family dioxygenase [Novosphingobium nitrogenifigens]EGD57742.1 gamma-butyrobetaine dioxygenase [Novosphingobium nitrogenifigens DSM 19370]